MYPEIWGPKNLLASEIWWFNNKLQILRKNVALKIFVHIFEL